MSVFVTPQPLAYFVGGDRFSRQFRDVPTVTTGPFKAFAGASPPTDGNVDSGVALGVEFYVTSAASLTDILWWQPTTTSDGTARQGALFTAIDGIQVVLPTSGAAPAAPGWQTITLSSPYALTPNIRYVAAVYHPNGGFVATGNYFTTLPDITNGPLVVPGTPNATSNLQGRFNYGVSLEFPDETFNGGNYWTDVSVS